MIIYRHKEEHQLTGNSKAQIKEAIGLKFPSTNEKQSHEILKKNTHPLQVRERKKNREAYIRSKLEKPVKGILLKDSKNYFQIFISRRAK